MILICALHGDPKKNVLKFGDIQKHIRLTTSDTTKEEL